MIFDGKCLPSDGLINSVFKLLLEWVSISKDFDKGMWEEFWSHCLVFVGAWLF